MAENNRSLMSEISTLITNSIQSIKRSNSEAVEDQLREIKKIRCEEPKSFKSKGNETQYKFKKPLEAFWRLQGIPIAIFLDDSVGPGSSRDIEESNGSVVRSMRFSS